jgi:DNA-binding winged helix-turn-helix (wHTH) protein
MLPPPTAARLIRFGIFEADLDAGELRKRGRKIKLQEQPFQVLAMLLEHGGEVVSREALRKRLWPDNVFIDFDQGLNKAIKKVREALDDSADHPRYIETLPKRGYRFISMVPGSNGSRRAGEGPQGRDAGTSEHSSSDLTRSWEVMHWLRRQCSRFSLAIFRRPTSKRTHSTA